MAADPEFFRTKETNLKMINTKKDGDEASYGGCGSNDLHLYPHTNVPSPQFKRMIELEAGGTDGEQSIINIKIDKEVLTLRNSKSK